MSTPSPPIDPRVSTILDYLAEALPDYPYNQQLDSLFVQELVDDFSSLDILEELKNLRWYSDNQPFKHASKPRLALRRWLTRAQRRHR